MVSASAQSDQSLRYPHEASLRPRLQQDQPFMAPAQLHRLINVYLIEGLEDRFWQATVYEMEAIFMSVLSEPSSVKNMLKSV